MLDTHIISTTAGEGQMLHCRGESDHAANPKAVHALFSVEIFALVLLAPIGWVSCGYQSLPSSCKDLPSGQA